MHRKITKKTGNKISLILNKEYFLTFAKVKWLKTKKKLYDSLHCRETSVAKDIARILGANKACNGYMEGNNYQVTWTFGHLCEFEGT